MGDKLGNFFQWFSSAITGFVLGFVFGWKLTLVIMAVSPLLVASGVIFSKVSWRQSTAVRVWHHLQQGKLASVHC